MKNKTRRFLSILLSLVMMLSLVSTTVFAADATSIVLTKSDGTTEEPIIPENMTDDTVSASDSTWTYTKSTNTLTLTGWSGQKITAVGSLNLKLVGNNMITLPETGSDTCTAISVGYGNTLTVTEDSTGTLTIKAENYDYNGLYPCAVAGTTCLNGGTLTFDVKAAATNDTLVTNRVFSNGHVYVNNDAVLNIKIDVSANTSNVNTAIWLTSTNNSYYFHPSGSATIDIDVKSNSVKDFTGAYLSMPNEATSAKISVKVSGGKAATEYRAAVVMGRLNLTGAGCFEFAGGTLEMSNFTTDRNTVTTTPANNEYIKGSIDPRDDYMRDASGAKVTAGKFVHTDTAPALTMVGGEVDSDGIHTYTLPVTKVGQSAPSGGWMDLYMGLRGAAGSVTFTKTGDLPAGLSINYLSRIAGSPTAPAAAGSITVTAKDGDNQTISFKVKWNDIVEADKFITVGSDPKVEMKSDGSGTGWSYDGNTKTLTLDGYNGGKIIADQSIDLKLVGTNTITLPETGSDTCTAISVGDYRNTVTVTEDSTGSLTIKAENYDYNGLYPSAVYGTTYLKGGTLTFNAKAAATNDTLVSERIFSGGDVYVQNNATLNIYLDVSANTGTTNQSIWLTSTNNSKYFYPSGSATINIDVTSNDVRDFNGAYLSMPAGATDAKISVKVSGGKAATEYRAARVMGRLNLTGAGCFEFAGGTLEMSNFTTDRNTVTTTPANNEYVKGSIDPRDSYMRDASGAKVTAGKFVHTDTAPALTMVGGEVDSDGIHTYTLPVTKIGQSAPSGGWMDLYMGLRGAAGSVTFTKTGDLPAGLSINYLSQIAGSPTAPAAAGSITVTAKDSDNQTISFKVKWNDITAVNRVTAVNVSADSVTLTRGETETVDVDVTVLPDNADYKKVYVSGGNTDIVTASVSEPDSTGKSVVTLRLPTNGIAGTTTVTVTSGDTGVSKQINVIVKEAATNAAIDYFTEELTGLVPSAKYLIDGAEFTADANGRIAITSDFLGKTLTIIKKGETSATNGDAQSLAVPARAAAPAGITVTTVSGDGASDGKITNVDSTMEYSSDGVAWTSVSGTSIGNLKAATYYVRYKATAAAFASHISTVSADLLNHDCSEHLTAVPAKAATCTETGNEAYYVCSCGKLYKDETAATQTTLADVTTPLAAHSYGEWQVKTAATCTAKGEEFRKCANCTAEETRELDMIPHDYADATCTAPKTCKHCPATEGEALGHDMSTEWSMNAENHWHECTRCDYIADNEGHTEGPAATEDTPQTCTVCGYVIKAALGHVCANHLEAVPAKAATCTETGNIAHYRCPDDGKLYADITGLNEVALADVTTAKDPSNHSGTEKTLKHDETQHWHEWNCCGAVDGEKADHAGGTATCTEKAVCATCGEKYGELAAHNHGSEWKSDAENHWHECECGDRKDAAAHTPGPDATEDTPQTCTVCGYVIKAALGHVCAGHLTKIDAKAATCTETGNIVYYSCTCGKLYADITGLNEVALADVTTAKDPSNHSDAESVLAYDETYHWHEWLCCTTVDGEMVKHAGGTATCTEKAVCDTCGAKYGELAAHDHGSEWKYDTTEHWHECECGDRKDAAAHTPGPDATEDTPQTCTVCGYVIKTALGHVCANNLTLTEKKEATHFEEGKEAYYGCTCGKYYEDAAGTVEITDIGAWGIIPKTDHVASEWMSDENNHWHECTIQGCDEKTEPEAHSFGWIIDREATGTEAGSKHEECSVCGYKKAAVEIPTAGSGAGQDTPQTGDNGMMLMWIALLFVSLGGAAGVTVLKKRGFAKK